MEPERLRGSFGSGCGGSTSGPSLAANGGTRGTWNGPVATTICFASICPCALWRTNVPSSRLSDWKSPVVTAVYTHLTSLCKTQHQKRLDEFMSNL